MASKQLHRGDLVSYTMDGRAQSGVFEGLSAGETHAALRGPTPLTSDQVTLHKVEEVGVVHCPHYWLDEQSYVLNDRLWVMSRVEWEGMPRTLSAPGEKDWRLRISEPVAAVYKGRGRVPIARVFEGFGETLDVTTITGEIVAQIKNVGPEIWLLGVTGCDVAVVRSPQRAYQLVFGLDIIVQPRTPADNRPLAELKGSP